MKLGANNSRKTRECPSADKFVKTVLVRSGRETGQGVFICSRMSSQQVQMYNKHKKLKGWWTWLANPGGRSSCLIRTWHYLIPSSFYFLQREKRRCQWLLQPTVSK